MDATFREALLTAPDEGFSLWATGDRASPECEQLVAIAESLPLPTLVAAHAALASAASAAEPVWRELGAAGVTVGAFLGVTSSLMASSDADVAATAAAIYLAGARCAGAVPFGVLNPMAAFELSKAVRTEAFTRLRGAEAAPPAKSAGRKCVGSPCPHFPHALPNCTVLPSFQARQAGGERGLRLGRGGRLRRQRQGRDACPRRSRARAAARAGGPAPTGPRPT